MQVLVFLPGPTPFPSSSLLQHHHHVGDEIPKHLSLLLLPMLWRKPATIFSPLCPIPIFHSIHPLPIRVCPAVPSGCGHLVLGGAYGSLYGCVGEVGVAHLQLPVDLKNLTQLNKPLWVCINKDRFIDLLITNMLAFFFFGKRSLETRKLAGCIRKLDKTKMYMIIHACTLHVENCWDFLWSYTTF